MSHVDAFQDGLLAAKAGKKMVARLQFEQVTELEPSFIHGWLWLAWTADSPEQAEQYLATAEKLDPSNRLVTTYKEIVAALAIYEVDDDFSSFLTSKHPIESVEESQAQDDSDSTDEELDEVQDELESIAESSADNEEEVDNEVDEKLSVDLSYVEQEVVIEGVSNHEIAQEEPDSKDDAGQVETKDFEEIRSEIAAATESEKKPSENSPVADVFEENTWEFQLEAEEDPTKTTSNGGSDTVDAATVAAALEEVSHDTADEKEARIAADVRELSEDVQATVGVEATESEPAPTVAKPSEEKELSTEAEEATAEDESASEVKRVPTILVVDDSPTVRKLVTMTLKTGGFQVETAEDGVEAMKMLVNLTPDLILLDVNMPRMDGYKLCKLIKRHEKTKFIPVVMLSGKDGMFDKLRGTLVGCNDYISKPFESADLLRHVEEYVYALSDN